MLALAVLLLLGWDQGISWPFISSLCCDISVCKGRAVAAYPVVPCSGQAGSDPGCVPLGDSVEVGFSSPRLLTPVLQGLTVTTVSDALGIAWCPQLKHDGV